MSDLCPDMREGKGLLIQSHLLSCSVESEGYCKCWWGVWGVLTMAGPHRGLPQPEAGCVRPQRS